LNSKVRFSIYDFFNSLKNKSLSVREYVNYCEDYKKYKNRWDYLKTYCIKDVEIMINPINNKIKKIEDKNGLDMFSFLSMSVLANADKYKCMYEDFDVDKDYRIYSYKDVPFELNMECCKMKEK
jgi:hypothetical protein